MLEALAAPSKSRPRGPGARSNFERRCQVPPGGLATCRGILFGQPRDRQARRSDDQLHRGLSVVPVTDEKKHQEARLLDLEIETGPIGTSTEMKQERKKVREAVNKMYLESVMNGSENILKRLDDRGCRRR